MKYTQERLMGMSVAQLTGLARMRGLLRSRNSHMQADRYHGVNKASLVRMILSAQEEGAEYATSVVQCSVQGCQATFEVSYPVKLSTKSMRYHQLVRARASEAGWYAPVGGRYCPQHLAEGERKAAR